MTNKNKQALIDFEKDISCLKPLDKWTNNINIFEVLKVTNQEIRHSNFLAWLFDPIENHGLSDSFIKAFITELAYKHYSEKGNKICESSQDFSSYRVYRESNNMDIVLLSQKEKSVIIIENKVWSSESSNQLKKYYDKSITEFKDCHQRLYVYLTPDGKEASKPENWTSFSYKNIIDLLETAIIGKELRDEVKLVLKNYIDIVRKNIMQQKDSELENICRDIYSKHRTALRLIFETVGINETIENEIICNTLRKLEEEGKIIYKVNNQWFFFTKSMDEFLPTLAKEESSWGTDWVYYYWFRKGNNSLNIRLELGGQNLTNELRKKTNSLIIASNKKLNEYKYKTIYSSSVKLSEEDENYEEKLEKAVKDLVCRALENEAKLLAKVL